jgi:hypothetical protein
MAQVSWNDQGDPCTVSVEQFTIQMTDQDMHDLHECLEFLFGKPGL